MRAPAQLVMLVIACVLPFISIAQAADGDHLDRINASKTVRVCIWPDYYSITYRNPKTQQLSGIDIDLANELGKDLGVAVQFVDSSFAKLIDDVTQDRCDIAMFAIGITPLRAEKLRFTPPPSGQRHLRHHHQNQPPHQILGRHRQGRFGGGCGQGHAA